MAVGTTAIACIDMFVVIEGGYDDDGSWYLVDVYVFDTPEEAFAFKPTYMSHSTGVYEAKNGDALYERIYDKGYDSGYSSAISSAMGW